MLVRLNINGTSADIEEAEFVNFASLPFGSKDKGHEADLEKLLSDNVDLIKPNDDEDETLLIIGRQVRTATGKTMDLVAFDNTGALILVEVKRDAKDVKARKDNAEIQAIRYAASLATLRTLDELVVKLYAPYIDKYQEEDRKKNAEGRSAVEWARKKLGEFIDTNAIGTEQINHTQKIVLIGAGFDDDTKSAAAWMAENGLPLKVIEVRPYKLGDNFALDVQQIIPPPSNKDYYVDVMARRSERRSEENTANEKTSRPRVKEIAEAGLIKVGEPIWFKNKTEPEYRAHLIADGKCEYKGKQMSILSFAKQMSGWSAISIYDWIIYGGNFKLLRDLRYELEAQWASETQVDQLQITE